MTPIPHIPELLTGEQVADRIGLSRERVRQLTGRPDFPPPVGRIGKAVVWHADDVMAYKHGTRAFAKINGVSIDREKLIELASKVEGDDLHRDLAALADTGGSLDVSGNRAWQLISALQVWVHQMGGDALGDRLLGLRDALLHETEPFEIFGRLAGGRPEFQLLRHGDALTDWTDSYETIARELKSRGGEMPLFIDRSSGLTSDGRRISWEVLESLS